MVLIHPTSQHGFYDAFFAQCTKAGAKPRISQYAYDVQTKMWLISAGFGVAPTPPPPAVSPPPPPPPPRAEPRRPGLTFRPLPPGLPPVQIALVWHRDDHSPARQHFCASFKPLGTGTEKLSP